MKTLTNEDIDALYKELSQYEKDNPGTKYGADFPLFAAVCLGSQAVKHWSIRSAMEAIVMPARLQEMAEKNPEIKENPEEFREALTGPDNPYRQMFLKAIYLGYRLGLNDASSSEPVN
jgi:hypothetical protein